MHYTYIVYFVQIEMIILNLTGINNNNLMSIHIYTIFYFSNYIGNLSLVTIT